MLRWLASDKRSSLFAAASAMKKKQMFYDTDPCINKLEWFSFHLCQKISELGLANGLAHKR
jgi:hypothetical protein